ncbi:hypothetical protein AKG11_28280 [Shinella sp. SUS2]|uniref:hypothetical protein n=1 Tax=unclassified Shinella TaxID=2643062 RepID=UPI0006829D22|nr:MULTISPECIES: hypothetical protein [unclassified Shinella]KNY13634.1 hypothetical protein AKG11_28280 [Shinella sp. SUS2]KOC72527.1 hypothetical protein AKG10_27145 [Shinella sp. GWS1]
MTHASYNDALLEEEARVTGIYPIGMIGDTESPPEWFTSLWEDTEDLNDPLFDALPELKAVMVEDAAEWARALVLRSRSGFIVRFEICVRHYYPPPVTSYQSSWNWVQEGTLYAETIEEIGPAVLKQAREQHQAEQQNPSVRTFVREAGAQ